MGKGWLGACDGVGGWSVPPVSGRCHPAGTQRRPPTFRFHRRLFLRSSFHALPRTAPHKAWPEHKTTLRSIPAKLLTPVAAQAALQHGAVCGTGARLCRPGHICGGKSPPPSRQARQVGRAPSHLGALGVVAVLPFQGLETFHTNVSKAWKKRPSRFPILGKRR